MKNLMNTNNEIVSRQNLSLLSDNFSDNFTPLLPFQEVPEILDSFVEIIIQGRIIDEFGLPLSGVLVEMWHPLHFGYFGVEYGPAFAPTDPDEQGWACTITDEQGVFCFKTEKRPSILGFPSASIDLKVTDEHANVSLAKLYLDENISNPTDPYLMDMEMEERTQFIGQEKDGVYMFDIQL
ncbi:MAG: hypothetical protein R2825_29880 [Saprospiraceae bacterium]